MAKKKNNRYSGIGGQAVLEGVMMKNKEKYAVAVRKPDGTIALDTENYGGIAGESKLARIPFVRGIFNFIDSMFSTFNSVFFEKNLLKNIIVLFNSDNRLSAGSLRSQSRTTASNLLITAILTEF